jgi:hypothetical protein
METFVDRYEAYDPETGEVVGVWHLCRYSEQEVKGFRDEWHKGKPLRRVTYTEHVEELG